MKPMKRYILRYWYAYLAAILFLMTSIFLDTLSPQITRRIIDDVIIGEQTDLLLKLLGMILIIGVGRAIFQYAKEMTFDLTSQKISVRIRQDLFRHIQSLSVNYFDKTNTGELMARIKDDVDTLCGGLGYIGMLMIELTFHICLVMYNMLTLSPKLSVLPILFIPVVGTLAIILEKKLDKVYSDISEENAKLNTVAQETLKLIINQPFGVTENVGKYDVVANVVGGGISGQAGAIRHGIARALLVADETTRGALKAAGLLTRDPRMKERKKYGLKAARRAPQFSKR